MRIAIALIFSLLVAGCQTPGAIRVDCEADLEPINVPQVVASESRVAEEDAEPPAENLKDLTAENADEH